MTVGTGRNEGVGACGGIDTLFEIDTHQALCHIPRTTPVIASLGRRPHKGGVSFFAPMMELGGGCTPAGMDSGLRRSAV